MSRKDYTFRISGAVRLSLDSEEFKGCTVRQAEEIIRRELLSGGNDPEPVDVTLAALDLTGG